MSGKCRCWQRLASGNKVCFQSGRKVSSEILSHFDKVISAGAGELMDSIDRRSKLEGHGHNIVKSNYPIAGVPVIASCGRVA